MIVQINTHPIVREVHEEYHIDWCGRIIDTKPKIRNSKPVFFIRGGKGCMELNTADIEDVERTAKVLTYPHGRASITTDKAYIYIVEQDNKKTLLGTVTHNHIKEYQRMFDDFECI